MAKGDVFERIYNIITRADTKGLDQTEKKLKDVEKQEKATQKQTGLLNEGMSQLGTRLGAMLGAAAVFAIFKEGVQSFARLERQTNALKMQLQGLGFESEKTAARVVEFLTALEQSGGAPIEDSMRAYQKFIGLTKDVNAAMAATRLAADIAESGVMDVNAAAMQLSAVIEGKAEGALVALGIGLEKTNDKTHVAEQAMAEIQARFGKMSDGISDTQTALSQMEGGWALFTRTLGEAVAPAVSKLGMWLTNTVKFLQSAGVVAGEFVNKFALGFESLTTIAGDFWTALTTWDFSNLSTNIQGEMENLANRLVAVEASTTEELAKIWENSLADESAAIAEGMKTLVTKSGEAGRLAREKVGEQQEAFERAQEQKLLMLRINAAMQYGDERLALELKLLEDQHEQAVEAARKLGASTKAIDEAFRMEREALIRGHHERVSANEAAMRQASYEGHRKHLEALAAAEAMEEERKQAAFDAELAVISAQLGLVNGLTLEKRIELEKQLARADRDRLLRTAKTAREMLAIIEKWKLEEAAIDERAEASKQEMAMQTATNALTLAGYVFGNNKALQTAQAIINTYAAVQGAWADTPGPVWVRAAAAAVALGAGLANLRAIQEAELTTSAGAFDDPVNDRLAFLGGRKSVEDFIRLTREGMAAGVRDIQLESLRAAPPSGSGDGLTVHFHAPVYGGPSGMREVARTLDRARRRDRARELV